MGRLVPFLFISLLLHASGIVALTNLAPAPTGFHGSPDGDPDRVFVCVVADEDVTAVAPVPSPVDAPASVESKEVIEEEVTPEPTPEILAREEPDVPPEFPTTPMEETPKPEPPRKEAEVQPSEEPLESASSNPQVASAQQKRRAALGEELRDFQSLILAAIRQAAFFPREAIRNKRRGEVVIRFVIDPEGTLSVVQVVKTSGSSTLDEAAKEIIRRAAQHFPGVPAGAEPGDLSYTIPVRFTKKRRSGAS